MRNENGKSGMKFLVILLIVSIILAGGFLAVKIFQDRQNAQTEEVAQVEDLFNEIEEEPIVVKEVSIYKGTDRPIAVMIDNNKDAWPHAGLNEAYAVYEIIVEGGESRLMALFKGKDLEKIGPIRSARHYFLDYALENDAIFTHYGQSPQAEKDIKSLKVDNVNGLIYSKNDFWRVKDKSAPHNAVTSTENILNIAENKKSYRTTSDAESVLTYSVDEIELESDIVVDAVEIPYSKSNLVRYEYNPETKRYVRYSKKILQTDWDTKEEITTKNIIITFARNTTLNDGENKGRQNLKNVDTLDGYYITNGKAIKITCEKTARAQQTIYRDLAGEEIKVNDGNTFFQICPIDAEVEFIENEPLDTPDENTIGNDVATNTTKNTVED